MNETLGNLVENAAFHDRIAAQYDRWIARITLGQAGRLRQICVDRLVAQSHITRIRDGRLAIAPPATPVVVDLMSGGGEAWPPLQKAFPRARITALDHSVQMHARAMARRAPDQTGRIAPDVQNVLSNALADDSADYVLSCFGLAGLGAREIGTLAEQIARILKPGGAFALIDLAEPENPAIRRVLHGGRNLLMQRREHPPAPYPVLPDPAAELGTALRDLGLQAQGLRHMLGMASSVAGIKPVAMGAAGD